MQRILELIDAAGPPPDAAELVAQSEGRERPEKSRRPKRPTRSSKTRESEDSERRAGGMAEGKPADVSRVPDGGTGDGGDDDDEGAEGFSVERLNREFALVLLGSKAVVFLEQPRAPIEDQKRILTLDAFKAWFSNKF